MASRSETGVVYGAGVVQGIALVTFPAASTILTDPAEYDLSSTQYGALFLPQVVTAIAAALAGASLSGRFGTKRVYVAGLGVGLGLTVPALNTLAAAFHRERPDRAILVLNALLGFGTVLAPVFVAIFD